MLLLEINAINKDYMNRSIILRNKYISAITHKMVRMENKATVRSQHNASWIDVIASFILVLATKQESEIEYSITNTSNSDYA